MVVLWHIGGWQTAESAPHPIGTMRSGTPRAFAGPAANTVAFSIAILVVLTFSKYVYLVSLTSYYTFYLIERFHVSVQQSQFYLFVFLFAVAVGTIVGGPVGDRIGRKRVIWVSILGVAPFYALAAACGPRDSPSVLSVVIGLILASAFSAILVYAQELMPGQRRHGGGSLLRPRLRHRWHRRRGARERRRPRGMIAVFHGCAYLPLLGLLTAFLPDLETKRRGK